MAGIPGGALRAPEHAAAGNHAASDTGAYLDKQHVINSRQATLVLADRHQVHVVFD
jgi:hypothetical protein